MNALTGPRAASFLLIHLVLSGLSSVHAFMVPSIGKTCISFSDPGAIARGKVRPVFSCGCIQCISLDISFEAACYFFKRLPASVSFRDAFIVFLVCWTRTLIFPPSLSVSVPGHPADADVKRRDAACCCLKMRNSEIVPYLENIAHFLSMSLHGAARDVCRGSEGRYPQFSLSDPLPWTSPASSRCLPT
jgi:hypothetical protein